jgi:hypothetical protein
LPLEDGEYMRINGDLKKLGHWHKGDGPMKMTIGDERVGLTGEIIMPWEFTISLSQK